MKIKKVSQILEEFWTEAKKTTTKLELEALVGNYTELINEQYSHRVGQMFSKDKK